MASHASNSQQAATQSPSSSTPSSSWTEPPWSGWIETTGDALIILEAARRGLIPRVTRRLVDSERKMITSGSVFVFDEDESGIKRWTDGFFWSPSRILGNFLLYRETDKRGAGHRGARAESTENSSLLVNEQAQYNADGTKQEQHSLSRPKGEVSSTGLDKQRERSLVGSLTNSYKFKPDGMMKKTFSLTIGGVSQHLISYYKIEDVEQGRLRTPSSLPELASLDISPEYLDKTHFRNPPKVEYDIDGIPRYRGEADEAEPAPRTTISAPLSSGQPLLLETRASAENEGGGSGKRPKNRYDPYSGNTTKRSRKKNNPAAASGVDPHAHAHPGSPHTVSPTIHGHGHAHPHPHGSLHQATMYGSPNDPQHQGTGVGPPAPPGVGPHFPPYGVNYYHQVPPGYPMPPPHVFVPPPGTPGGAPAGAGGSSAAGGAGASTPPPTSASGVVSPAPGAGGAPLSSYAGYPPAGAATDAQGQPVGAYTYYPPPSSASHFASAPPYGGAMWSPYTYAPQHGVAAPASPGNKGGDGANGQQTAVASDEA